MTDRQTPLSDDSLAAAFAPVGEKVPPPTGPKAKSGRRNTIEWIAIVAGALLVAFVVRTFLIQAFYIPSESMLPTLKVRDRVLVNKLSYDLHGVGRGDIVVFKSPESAGGGKDLIKRVIGLPGDTVESRDGAMVVNGELIDEPYLPNGVTTNPAVARTTVPPGHYWMMGDNRSSSRDSRYFGTVPKALIVGKAFVKVWPLKSIGLL